MIWESHFWKDDLLKKAAKLIEQKSQVRWPECSLARLEQTLMLGFYGIRKLHEAAKLSTSTMRHSIELTAHPWREKSVTKLNWHKLEDLYDFELGVTVERDLTFICHQFVHSFVFVPTFGERHRLDGVVFASDHQRHKALLHLSIDQIIDQFQRVGNDYPNVSRSILNPQTGDYDITAEMVTDE